jgi:hypothetical protein
LASCQGSTGSAAAASGARHKYKYIPFM